MNHKSSLYDLVIIGGGPAGITAGIYAGRKKIKTLLLTGNFIGQVGKTGRVDNYPGFFGIIGQDLMGKFKDHLKKFDIEIVEGEKVRKVTLLSAQGDTACRFSIKTKSKQEFLTKAVLVATGRDPRPLEIPGEKEFIGKGISYCSICDSPFFRDKSVAVVGGGNAGFEAAIDLAKYAKRIFIFERSNKITADELLQQQVKKETKIQVHLNKELKKIEGKDKVQDIVYQDLKTSKTFQVPIDGVFVQIGSVPATGFLKGLVDFNERDEIKVDFQTCQTSTEGIFAAGDVNDGRWKQIIIAAGEGCRAALATYEYLQRKNV